MNRRKTIAAIAAVGLIGLGAGLTANAVKSSADPAPAFSATFDTAADFYNRFDYGLSGQSLAGRGNPNTVALEDASETPHYMGDHDLNCGAPTTQRPVYISGETWTNGNHFPNIDFSQLFWHCAPNNDPALGHLMTGMTTLGYNHLWFSPKPEFTGITKVCWDLNETTEGGKWTEVQFVGHADAVRYPTGTHTGDSSVARGTGGFDLGYTTPEFRQGQPSTGIFPSGGTLAGLKDFEGIFDWWQNQDTTTAGGVGWPGQLPNQGGNGGPITDKATRYQKCVENVGTSQIKITNNRPDGIKTYTVNGHIPQDSVRVVFHDSEYDGPKRDFYNPNALTWHWDNIQVFTAAGPPPTTTLPPTTTTTTSTTVPPTTTTVAPTTTVPPTTTTTTVPPTTTTAAPTTTLPPTTTTTVPDPCPSTFNAEERAWCASVNARLHALDGG